MALVAAESTATGTGSTDPMQKAFAVVERGTRSGDWTARARAVEALPLVKGQDIAPYLSEAMKDHQWPVRKAALKVLAARGDAEARKGVAATLCEQASSDKAVLDVLSVFSVDQSRAMLLATLLDPACPTRDALLGATMSSGREDLPVIMAAGLAKADPLFAQRLKEVPREELGTLLGALIRDKDPKVVAPALQSALESKVNLPAASLKPLLKSTVPEIRYGAAELLARQKESGAAVVLAPLMDTDAAGRVRYLTAVALAPTPDALPVLQKMLEGAHPVEEWIPAYEALAVIGDAAAKKRIEDDLGATLLERRIAATRAIGRLQGTRALFNLHTLLFDGNPLVRQMAAESIGELAQSESIEFLERALRDSERDVRVAVTRALAAIRDKAAVGVLSYLVSDMDQDVRKAAILGICGLNHDSALTTLRVAMEDPDPEVRIGVLKALIVLDKETALTHFERSLGAMTADEMARLTGEFKTEFLPFLKKALESDREWARTAALRSIAQLPEEAVAFLKETAVINRFPDTRQAALQRLVRTSPKDAMEVAGALLEDSDVDVRVTAIGVFNATGGKAPERIMAALDSGEELVRLAAATAILKGSGSPARAIKPGKPAKSGKPTKR